ncbi:MAG TPA: PA2169 family four-helix-bundle protein [Sphingomicrobium sp.]|nr:PA2169 family four-helix-bundle protein [Sphingomicrobium sp.]
MFDKDNDGLAVLKTLTDTLADSVNGYREAAQHVGSAEFKQMFTELGDERSQVLSDLQAELGRLGGSADRDGTTMGTLHQRWLDLKASITGNDDKAVINEVERGEDYLKEKFETAMASDKLDGAVRGIVEQAYGSVREGHDRVSALKHSLEGQPASS